MFRCGWTNSITQRVHISLGKCSSLILVHIVPPPTPPPAPPEVPLSYAAKIFSYSESANIVAAAAIDCSLLPLLLPRPLPLPLCSCPPHPLLPLPVGCCFAFWWLQINHTLNMAITRRAPPQQAQAQAQAQAGSDREALSSCGTPELRGKYAYACRLISRCRVSMAQLHCKKKLSANWIQIIMSDIGNSLFSYY